MFVTNEIEADKLEYISSFNFSEEEKTNLFSDLKLGSFIDEGNTYFRIFAPGAKQIVLCLFNKPTDTEFQKYKLNPLRDGVWEIIIEGILEGKYYGYRIYNDNSDFETEKVICLDPYAKAVAAKLDFMAPKLSVVYDREFDWEGDAWVQNDWRDLIIYEAHIKDLTAHNSSGAEKGGTYSGLTQKGIKGGLEHIKKLGINTIEILPSMEFAHYELPYKTEFNRRFNTWNPYQTNHWGYMTSAFFAPTANYSSESIDAQKGDWIGVSGDQVNEFKDMIKAIHREGIAVIMDVVFNHLSEYELANLKEIDQDYYFRYNHDGTPSNESGCANDLKTENPMVRRLIIDSILYWMKEYHIDGFRFDLGHLIDWETLEEVKREAQKYNPHVVFVTEPWGGGYDPKGFSVRGIGSWNDQIRNGVKGENPYNGKGWLFGEWYGNNNPDRIKSYVRGTLKRDHNGIFNKKEHSVNYLASHDGYTLGDFIRIASGEVNPHFPVENIENHFKLSENQLKLNKLAAAFLLTSQGIAMIHAGQEFARSKVIVKDENVPDERVGFLDHNSYEKDNETNYLNYEHADLNKELVEYYKGLIELRKKHSAFRHAEYESIQFTDDPENPFFICYNLNHNDEEFLVVLNSNAGQTSEMKTPEGEWILIADDEKVMNDGEAFNKSEITAGPLSIFILRRKI